MRKGKKGFFIAIGADILIFGVFLMVFALFHHVLPYEKAINEAIVPIPDNIPDFSEKFPDKFTAGEVIKTENSYRDANISLELSEIEYEGAVCHICDIYVRRATDIKTAFANDTFGRGFADSTLNISRENNAVFAVSGDYYGIRNRGVVIRNGMICRTDKAHDICILYYDGSMETYDYYDFNIASAIKKGAWQAWDFGPELLDDGKEIKEFNTGISGNNPRIGIGYFEEGHYLFLAADGRQESSKGLSLAEMSSFFAKAGCKNAYNLDGGHSAVMTLYGEIANSPSKKGGRDISDIIYVSAN